MRQHRGSTLRKLEEAHFFLGQLAPNYMKDRKFDFYLSAFISSARAVPWVMRSEYGKLVGWKSWYEGRKPSAQEARLLDGTNSLRTRLTKQEALRTTTRIQLKGVNLAKPELDRVNSALSSGNVPIRLSGSRGKYSLKVEVDGKTILCPATDV